MKLNFSESYELIQIHRIHSKLKVRIDRIDRIHSDWYSDWPDSFWFKVQINSDYFGLQFRIDFEWASDWFGLKTNFRIWLEWNCLVRTQIPEWFGKFRIGSEWISIQNFGQGVVRRAIFTSLEMNKKVTGGQTRWIRWNSVIIGILIPWIDPRNRAGVHPCIVLMEEDLYLFQMRTFFPYFFAQPVQKRCIILFSYRLSFFQVIGVDDSACISKIRGHHLVGRFRRVRLLWIPFAFKCPLFWLFFCLWNVVVYPCFFPSYVSTQKLVRIAWEKHQNSLRVDHMIAFILLWEQTQHPSCRDFFHTQFFVKNWKHCTLRYACGLNYFAHFDSLFTQNQFRASHFH